VETPVEDVEDLMGDLSRCIRGIFYHTFLTEGSNGILRSNAL